MEGTGNAHEHLWNCVLDVNAIDHQCASGKCVENQYGKVCLEVVLCVLLQST